MYENIIVIAGAGPTGLTLGCELARRKIPFRLIDAAPSPFQGSRGKGMQPRSLEILEDLGAIEAILAAGARYPKIRLHAGPFSLRAGSLDAGKKATDRVPYPNLWMVPQSRTEAILRERLGSLGARVEFGKTLATFRQRDDRVEVSLADGESITASYLVGCDGGHSAVRKTLGLTLEGEALDGEPTIVADLDMEGLDRRDWHIWPIGKGAPMGLCPLPQTTLFQLTAKAKCADTGLEKAVREVTGCRVVREAWSSIYRPSVRMVNRYRVERVFLAGDAAHVHPAAGGQGLNTGVQDAYNLGWKLAHVLRGGPDSLLDTYESERMPVAAAVLGLSKRLHQAPSIRRGDATNQLRLHYRGSLLSSGVAFGDLLPGDRMPDARLADGGRLFDQLRGTHATEVAMSGGVRILVRPDGYIASIGRTHCAEYAGEPTRVIRGPSRL